MAAMAVNVSKANLVAYDFQTAAIAVHSSVPLIFLLTSLPSLSFPSLTVPPYQGWDKIDLFFYALNVQSLRALRW